MLPWYVRRQAMWLILAAIVVSALAWTADRKRSHIPVREEERPIVVPDNDQASGGISRFLD
jgi:hypothetical protein